MKIKSYFVLIPLNLALASAMSHAAAYSPLIANAAVSPYDAEADSPSQETQYADGTRAINDGKWAEAETIFSTIAQQHGDRAEASTYWKAYAENKEGKPTRALETCTQLRHAYPHGNWVDECGALEIEIRGKSGDPMQPQAEQNEELKLLALNSLMQRDEAHALPIIQQILTTSNSPQLKDRALFVLAQDQSPAAQQMLGQIARDAKNPTLQKKAVQMIAVSGGKQSSAMLADIYRQSNDESVKESVVRAYLINGSSDQLEQLATHETDPRLRGAAIQELGAMGAARQLLDLYHQTSNDQAKAEIIRGLIPAGPKGADALASIANSETNPELRSEAIRNLGVGGGAAAAPALVTAYKKNSDLRTRKAAIQGLFLAGDSHDLIELARAEKDPALKQEIVQQLSVMQSKEATAYMLEILK
jgi:HEAT repeat protein